MPPENSQKLQSKNNLVPFLCVVTISVYLFRSNDSKNGRLKHTSFGVFIEKGGRVVRLHTEMTHNRFLTLQNPPKCNASELIEDSKPAPATPCCPAMKTSDLP